jgi:hypothetical protein
MDAIFYLIEEVQLKYQVPSSHPRHRNSTQDDEARGLQKPAEIC